MSEKNGDGKAFVQPEVCGQAIGARLEEVRQGGEGGEEQAEEGHREGKHGSGKNSRREW